MKVVHSTVAGEDVDVYKKVGEGDVDRVSVTKMPNFLFGQTWAKAVTRLILKSRYEKCSFLYAKIG